MRLTTPVALAAALLLATACRSDKKAPADAHLGSGQRFPSDAPSTRACQRDDDCTVIVDGPLGSDPCCDVTVTTASVSRAYLAFMATYKAKHCAGVSCPPLMLPGALPASCASVPRCKSGQCDNACGEDASHP